MDIKVVFKRDLVPLVDRFPLTVTLKEISQLYRKVSVFNYLLRSLNIIYIFPTSHTPGLEVVLGNFPVFTIAPVLYDTPCHLSLMCVQ